MIEIRHPEIGESIDSIIQRIVCAHEELATFWSDPRGWAPIEVSTIFERCRLDRQVQLARCLQLWVERGEPENDDGRLILARANLGALVEGAMQLALTVFHQDYENSTNARRTNGGDIVESPELMLAQLQSFFRKEFWTRSQVDRWNPWVERIRLRRNAVHAFCGRDLGTHDEFLDDIRTYLEFLAEINERLPYPDTPA